MMFLNQKTNTKIMELSTEKSQEQAEIIKSIALLVSVLDVDYCRQAGKDMKEQALRQETISILNPSHPQIKNNILQAQGNALLSLCDYVDSLKKINELQKKLSEEQKVRHEISKMFI